MRWYPGHMKKGRRAIRENLSLVDVVLEVVDARIPYTGRNQDLDKIIGTKKRILILNKRDLAQEEISKGWIDYYRRKLPVVLMDARKGRGKEKLLTIISKVKGDGRDLHPPRLMVMGIPNVGKSLLINLLLKRKKVLVGARPGLTKGKQWIKVKEGFQLLDTPGILPPVIKGEEEVFKLAVTAALPLDELDKEDVALGLLSLLKENNRSFLQRRFNLTGIPQDDVEILMALGEGRGFLKAGKKIDTHRTSIALLKEFQEGNLGPLTLEYPPREE